MNELITQLIGRGLSTQEWIYVGIIAAVLLTFLVILIVHLVKNHSAKHRAEADAAQEVLPMDIVKVRDARSDDDLADAGSNASVSDTIDMLADNRAVRIARRPHTAHKSSSGIKALLGGKKRDENQQLKEKGKRLSVPKTVQDTIPYTRVYPEHGIIETAPNVYTKAYLLRDTNYDSASDEDKAAMATKYQEFLNSFSENIKFQLLIDQKNIDMEEFEAQTMLKYQDDGLNDLREERNQMMRKKVLDKRKYIIVSSELENLDDAVTLFARLDKSIPNYLKKLGQAAAYPMDIVERLELMHDMYNVGQEGCFGNNTVRTKNRDGEVEYVWGDPKFSLDIMHRMGLTTKDVIAPDYFEFKSNYGMCGEKYFRALYLRHVPELISDSIIKDITSTTIDMSTALHFTLIPTDQATKRVKSRLRNIDASLLDKQKKASQSGYSVDLISHELRDSHEQTAALLEELSRKSQNMFEMTLVIVHYADTKEQLDSDTKQLQSVVAAQKLRLAMLSEQQEIGLDAVMPLGINGIKASITLTTESASAFTPFVNMELIDHDGGMLYGFNKISGNPILLNRRNLKNGNGFIFGTPGSGKSMTAKQEMLTVMLSTMDTVLVVDPEAEYYSMAEMLGGEVVRIAAGSNVYINPMDIDMGANSEDDPLAIKSDFIASFCDCIAGERNCISPAQRSIIDRCVKKSYEPYLSSYDPVTKSYDPEKMPTLVDFYNIVKQQQGFDAAQLRDMLELYVVGSQNIFAHRTNVDYKGRFVVFDIRDTGATLKNAALLVVLDYVWNKIVDGRRKGQYTWFFIDEIYLLFKQASSAEFLKNLYKRARKYYGIPTGITQNVSDLLRDETARTMIANSECLIMLDQKSEDRLILQELLHMSDTELSYITNSNPGEGILYNGTCCIPFNNQLNRNTMQYKAMTTKPGEAAAKGELKAIAEKVRAANQRRAAASAEKDGVSDD